MGSNTSVINKESFIKNVTDASTRILSEDQKFSSTTQDFNQEQKVTLSGVTVNCGFEAIQDMKVETRVFNQLNAESELDLANQLRDQMESILNNSIDQDQSGISLGQVNTSVENTSANQEIMNDMSTRISRIISQSINNALQAKQGQDFNFVNTTFECPTDPNGRGLLLRQNLDVKSVIENSLSSLEATDITNDEDTLTLVESESDASQTVSGLFNDTFSIVIGVIAGIAILAGVITAYFKLYKPWREKKKKDTNTVDFGNLFGFTAKRKRRRRRK